MKADGGALVYIIIGLISLIVSVVEKNRKKNASSQRTVPSGNPTPQPENKPEWQKELEDIFGKRYAEPQGRPYEQDIPSGSEEIPVPQSNAAKKIPYQEPVTEEIGSYKKTEVITQPVQETVLSKSAVYSTAGFEFAGDHEMGVRIDAEDFDLKKAIIYAEVINRKYF